MKINRVIKNVSVDSNDDRVNKAIEHIMCAVDELGHMVSSDASYKDDIANLGVVVFDIKGKHRSK